MLDATILSRIQFGFTMTAHIVYPSVSIGIVMFLVFMEGRYLWSKNPVYLNICKFCLLFALTFGMGVVSGIVMEFQFGTNWGGFSEKVGPILGALLPTKYSLLFYRGRLSWHYAFRLEQGGCLSTLFIYLYGGVWHNIVCVYGYERKLMDASTRALRCNRARSVYIN